MAREQYNTSLKPRTIIRVAKNQDNPYVVIHQAVFVDPNLSWKAKGLMGYFLSRPDDWQIHVADLLRRSRDGRDSVYVGLAELRRQGYLEERIHRLPDGRIHYREYVVYEQPRAASFTPAELDPDFPDQAEPHPDLPDPAFPDQANPDREKPPLLSIEKELSKDLLLSTDQHQKMEDEDDRTPVVCDPAQNRSGLDPITPLQAYNGDAESFGERRRDPRARARKVVRCLLRDPSPSAAKSTRVGQPGTPEEPAGRPESPAAWWHAVADAWFTHLGGDLPAVARQELAEDFRDLPAGVIGLALAEAAAHNARSWAYVRRVLLNWQAQGSRDAARRAGGRDGEAASRR